MLQLGEKWKSYSFWSWGGASIYPSKETYREQTTVNQYKLENLLKKIGIKEINILKMDVEGSEETIIRSSLRLLNSVSQIILEVHPSLINETNLLSYLKLAGF